uniref:hypothetical protein n=1 Tax=Jatropha curcas TaxID=180498 RepID=UPI0027A73412|nr:hypothetical protein QLP06_mgp003 [Jatropha curcas]WFG81118.1 hypothetical protein [Jatropha curcas]
MCSGTFLCGKGNCLIDLRESRELWRDVGVRDLSMLSGKSRRNWRRGWGKRRYCGFKNLGKSGSREGIVILLFSTLKTVCRRRRKRVEMLKNANGEWVDDQSSLRSMAL